MVKTIKMPLINLLLCFYIVIIFQEYLIIDYMAASDTVLSLTRAVSVGILIIDR